jgi:PHP family Zn ribbon phosphoesterase
MPQGDGTGPTGQGPGTCRGLGRGRGGGGAAGRAVGKGMGRMGGTRPGAGPGGQCVCPACGATVAHQVGTPCYNVNCPKCGGKMVRG